jgi:tripartite ATP-independent transporter DctP family solute receptor
MSTRRFRYRLRLNQSEASPTARRLVEMAAAIGRETDGELRIEVFPEGRLGFDPEMLAALRAGRLEFHLSGALLGDLAPSSALSLMPLAFRDSQAVFAALDGALGDRIRGELARHRLHAFRHTLQNGFHHLTTATRPIRAAEDLKGLKIRSPGGAIAEDFFCSLGAEAGYVPFNRMYGALKAGQFDGQSDPLGVVLSLRLYEVQAYLSLTSHWWSGFTLLADADLWAVLPAALQEVVERNAEKFALLQRRDVGTVNAARTERLAGLRMLVDTADTASFHAKLGPFYGRWRRRIGAAGWRLLEAYAGAVAG